MNNREYSVYIMSNFMKTVFYVGMTNNLERRVFEHKTKLNPGSFTARYDIKELLYYEDFDYVEDAIYRENNLKNWKREWKLNLIKDMNPDMIDLSAGWYRDEELK